MKGEIALKSALERETSVDQRIERTAGQPQPHYRVCVCVCGYQSNMGPGTVKRAIFLPSPTF